MIPTNPDYSDFILSQYPHEVTVGNLKSALAQNDEKSKQYVIDFIYHRLSHRYIVPLLHVPKEYKSGFLMMASACLMVETMESFHKGKKETRSGETKKVFKDFFTREKQFFPGFAEDSDNFYTKIRCGILHQAETKGGYRIMRKGPLFDVSTKQINANKFLKALKDCLKNYVADLAVAASDDPLWLNAAKKVTFISDNCVS